uniref:Uncharacterized protein n=1 Tax=Anopheles darlingi TaxID=43151 RepID=A0A2M4D8L1_ANODA
MFSSFLVLRVLQCYWFLISSLCLVERSEGEVLMVRSGWLFSSYICLRIAISGLLTFILMCCGCWRKVL